MKTETSLTVAICTYNRCALLGQTLENLTKVNEPAGPWSILIVDNNSSDNTAGVVEPFAERLSIRRVFEPTQGLSHARNRALREVSTDYIAFTDDDVLVEENWLVALANAIERYPDAAALGGPIEPWFPCEPDGELMDAFYWLRSGFCGLDHGRPEGPLAAGMHVWGANFALRLDRVCGIEFDCAFGPVGATAGGGDETSFLERVEARGGVIVWCPAMRVRHYVAPSRMTEQYLRQFAYQKGRESALRGRGDDGQWFGVPRWLWRQCATVELCSFAASALGVTPPFPERLRSGPKPVLDSKRVRQLAWRREQLYTRGMIAGVRESRKAEARTT